MKKIVQNKQVFLVTLLIFASGFFWNPKQSFAACGTYFANQPVGSQCNDAAAAGGNGNINPSVVCASNAAVCCSTAAECPGANQPTPTLPQNPGYEESTQDCGNLVNDPGLGRQVCLDSSNKILSNAQSCSRAPQCCREAGQCTVFYACDTTTFTCSASTTGTYTSQQSCAVGCRAPNTQAPLMTAVPVQGADPAPTAGYQSPVDRIFLFKVNPLTIEDDPDPEAAYQKGMWRILRFISPSATLNVALIYLFPLAGIILFVMIVWGGFEMVYGAADTKAQEAGKNRITAALIGFTLLFVSYWIAQILQYIFGVNILGNI